MEPDSQIYFCAESELEFLKKKRQEPGGYPEETARASTYPSIHPSSARSNWNRFSKPPWCSVTSTTSFKAGDVQNGSLHKT
jgi:hypothetical protein